MTVERLLQYINQFDVLILFVFGAVICYLPMRNQLRFRKIVLSLYCVAMLAVSYFGLRFLDRRVPELDPTLALVPFLCACFILYFYSVRANLAQALAMFFGSCTMMAILTYLTIILQELIPDGYRGMDPEILFSGIQVALSALMLLFIAHPLYHSGTFLIDNISRRITWVYTLPFSILTFVILNYLAPEDRGWFRDPELRWMYVIVFFGTSILYLLIVVFFGVISRTLKEDEDLRHQEAVFQMQRKQYDELNAFLKQSQVYRHDMRHLIRTLNDLANAGEYEELREFIHQANENMPENPVKFFCKDSAINALLNFYAEEMRKDEVTADFQIDLPAMESRQLVDLSGLLSNLLENALLALRDIPAEERRFALTIRTMNQTTLYIVSSNAFDGRYRRRRGKYLSTRLDQGGSGIGLDSMQTVAERYGGSMSAYHQGNNFFVDIMMKVSEPEEPVRA